MMELKIILGGLRGRFGNSFSMMSIFFHKVSSKLLMSLWQCMVGNYSIALTSRRLSKYPNYCHSPQNSHTGLQVFSAKLRNSNVQTANQPCVKSLLRSFTASFEEEVANIPHAVGMRSVGGGEDEVMTQ